MRKEEARREILRAWDEWAAKNNLVGDAAETGTAIILFHAFLQSKREDLLGFDDKGTDECRTIHDWLLNAGKVKE